MRNDRFHHLSWDTKFFGFKTARITPALLQETEFHELIETLRANGYVLVYWPADMSIPERFGPVIERHGGFLADMKTTFVRSLGAVDTNAVIAPGIVPYQSTMPEAEMVGLALQSGVLSRFAADPRIPAEKVEALYAQWIVKSMDRSIAEEVLVVRSEGTIGGLITLGNKNGRGEIGLLAVGQSHRGKGYGRALVNAAIRWFAVNGYSDSQVVTQGANHAACRLYEACGYRVESVQAFYHIWV
jgi:dTDP-4-amino-4,6-dideoxy-D-galactose acyltransferase